MQPPPLADGAVVAVADGGDHAHFCTLMAAIDRLLVARGVVVVVPTADSNDPLVHVCRLFAVGGPATPWLIVHALDWATGRRSAPHMSVDPLLTNSDRARAYVLARTTDLALHGEPMYAAGDPVYAVRDATLRVLGHTALERRGAALAEICRRYWPGGGHVLVPADDAADTVGRALLGRGCVPVVIGAAGLALRPLVPAAAPLDTAPFDMEL
jgi:hypothetical protein